jgi:hypothetical protein
MGVPIKKEKPNEKKEKLLKASRISKEEKRLRDSFTNIPDDIMRIADGLIRRAAFMRITLEDYEADLDSGGYVELFSQSVNTDPYERERPVARLYTTMNKNYQSIMKQLTDLVPKQAPKDEDDGFESFVSDR